MIYFKKKLLKLRRTHVIDINLADEMTFMSC